MINQLILAAAADADQMISGQWLIGAIGAVATGIALVVGKTQGRRQARAETTTLIEGQPISVAMASKMVTKDELAELENRLVTEIKKLEQALGKERDVARTANGNLHARIDKTSDSLNLMRGEIGQMNANLSRLIDLSMNPKPRTNPR
jgi:hypothetical protein